MGIRITTVGVLEDISPRTLKLAGITKIYIGRGGNPYQGFLLSDTGCWYRLTMNQRLEILCDKLRFTVGDAVPETDPDYPVHTGGEGFLRVKVNR